MRRRPLIRQSAIAWPITRSLIRIVRLAASFRFPDLTLELLAQLRFRRARRRVAASGIFDAPFYQAQFETAPADPLSHYLRTGAEEGRWPHPLFDSEWYLAQNADVKASGLNPLLHYIMTWQTEGRRTNPYFDPRWYLTANPDARRSGLDPLSHYLRIGAAEGADPSPDFATRWYGEQNAADLPKGTNPLVHFLHRGRHQGLAPCLRSFRFVHGRPVEEAQLFGPDRLPALGEEIALFVTHSPDGRLKPHLQTYLSALHAEGISVILIVAADRPLQPTEPWLSSLVTCVFVRQNVGYDFAAWSHLLRRHRELGNAEILYLLNDSLIGPADRAAFGDVIRRIRLSRADIVGLTENRERGWHIQSYFLAIKRGALASVAFHEFMLDVVSFADKTEVIDTFEVQMASRLQAAGLTVEVLFPTSAIHNPTLHDWKGLLDRGFPFIKVMAIRDTIQGVDKNGWEAALSARGYDVSLVHALLQTWVRPIADADTPSETLLAGHTDIERGSAPRIGYFGPLNYDNGLGFAARGYVSALMQRRLELGVYSIHRPFNAYRRMVPSVDFADFDGDCDIAIVHLNPDAWGTLLNERQLQLIAAARSRIGLFVWESRTIPDYLIEGFHQVDRIWAPSRFCAESYAAVTDKPIDIVPHVVEPVSVSASDRSMAQMAARLGLAGSDRLILYVFDASSYVARKNPQGLIRAFAKSGLAREGWKLLLKTKNLRQSSPDWIELQQLLAHSDNVVLINQNMSTTEIGVLLDLAEIYASSHCCEGFGLTIAEALARGKRVVATNYGGSCDFLTKETGFPVKFQEFRLSSDIGPYRAGTIWAAIDEEHFAFCLASAARLSRSSQRELAGAARAMVRDTLSAKAVASRMSASLVRALSEPPTIRAM